MHHIQRYFLLAVYFAFVGIIKLIFLFVLNILEKEIRIFSSIKYALIKRLTWTLLATDFRNKRKVWIVYFISKSILGFVILLNFNFFFHFENEFFFICLLSVDGINVFVNLTDTFIQDFWYILFVCSCKVLLLLMNIKILTQIDQNFAQTTFNLFNPGLFGVRLSTFVRCEFFDVGKLVKLLSWSLTKNLKFSPFINIKKFKIFILISQKKD